MKLLQDDLKLEPYNNKLLLKQIKQKQKEQLLEQMRLDKLLDKTNTLHEYQRAEMENLRKELEMLRKQKAEQERLRKLQQENERRYANFSAVKAQQKALQQHGDIKMAMDLARSDAANAMRQREEERVRQLQEKAFRQAKQAKQRKQRQEKERTRLFGSNIDIKQPQRRVGFDLTESKRVLNDSWY